MFDWLLPPTLDFVERHCVHFVRTSSMHMVKQMLVLYDSLLDELRLAVVLMHGSKLHGNEQQTELISYEVKVHIKSRNEMRVY